MTRQLVLLSLHGEQVSLVGYAPDGRTLVESAELVALRDRLHSDAGPEGWALVATDPMIRFAGPDTESDNAIATAFVQRLETLNRVAGHPTVLAAHHTDQVSRENGTAKPRGVTALIDAFRWVATLRVKNDGAAFRQFKSNYSRRMPDELDLIYEHQSGLLRALTEVEARERKEDAQMKSDAKEDETDANKDARTEKKITEAAENLRKALRSAPGPITTEKALIAAAGGHGPTHQIALERLKISGEVVKDGGRRGPLVLRTANRNQSQPDRNLIATGCAGESGGITTTTPSPGVWGDSDLSPTGKPDCSAERIATNGQGELKPVEDDDAWLGQ